MLEVCNVSKRLRWLPYPKQLHRVGRRSTAGFALVAVIWTLGLVVLLSTAVMVGTRYRGRGEASVSSSERTAAAAESAINLAILLLLAPQATAATVFPLSCTMPNGERAVITVEAEDGKLDLNAGSAKSLTALFVALAGDRATGERLVARILTARDPRSADAAPSAANVQIGFKSILELDRISGMTPVLLRAALPLLTVRSGRVEPDPALASAALLGLLNVPPGGPIQTRSNSDFTIRADVTVTRSGRFVQQALVSVRAENGRPYAIREWRRADVDVPAVDSGGASYCLDALQAKG